MLTTAKPCPSNYASPKPSDSPRCRTPPSRRRPNHHHAFLVWDAQTCNADTACRVCVIRFVCYPRQYFRQSIIFYPSTGIPSPWNIRFAPRNLTCLPPNQVKLGHHLCLGSSHQISLGPRAREISAGVATVRGTGIPGRFAALEAKSSGSQNGRTRMKNTHTRPNNINTAEELL